MRKKWQVVKVGSPRQKCSFLQCTPPDVDVGRLPLSPPKQLRPVIGQQLWPLSNRLCAAPREPQATRATKTWVRTVPRTCAWMDPRLIFSLPPDPKVDNVGLSPNVDIIWSLAKLVHLAPQIQRGSHKTLASSLEPNY